MDLIADRFVAVDARRVVDLADGGPIALITRAGGAEIDEMAWAVRCDRFSDVHHPSIARLVDYGALGGAQRFEAWRCGGAWQGPRPDAERAVRRAEAFLAASGLGSGPLSVADVRAHDGRAVVLPPPSCGYMATAGAVLEPVEHLDACGIASVSRRAVSAVAEVLADSAFHRPRIVAICGPPGAGLRTAAAVLARAARLNGVVPMACPVDDPRILTLTEDRSVLLIDRAGDAGGWRSLLDRTMSTPRAHVLLRVVARPPAEVRSVTLDPVPVEALIAAIRPAAIASSLRRRIEEAAGRARGLPGRFAALLWSADPDIARRGAFVGARVSPRVAEGPATYGSARISPGVPPGRAIRLCPQAGSEAMRRRMAQAIGALEGGRRAAGDRSLRAATAALARRHDWEQAAFGSVALARSVLRRGRPQAAQVILAEARDYAERAGSIQLAGEVAVACGLAHLDLARLDEAENVLEAAMSAARAADDPSARRACSLALARCLFWRGRYDRAARALAEIGEIGTTSQPAPDIAARLALVSLARRDIPTAVSGVVGAQEAAQRAGNRSHEAASAYAAAWVHLAIGDYPAVDRDVRGCIRAARGAHDPLTALKARLVGAEAARRAGRAGTAAGILGRIRRIATISLPPIVQARCALLGDLLSDVPADEAVRKRIASSGLEALALLVPPPVDPARAFHSALDEVVQILTVCQTADDEAAVLGRLCTRIPPAARGGRRRICLVRRPRARRARCRRRPASRLGHCRARVRRRAGDWPPCLAGRH